MADITQAPYTSNMQFVKGDDFTFTIIFPMTITDYTIVGSVGSTSLTVTKLNATQVQISLTDTQTNALTSNSPWFLKLTKDDYTRTWVKGVFIAI